jgi:hypothetical protein
LLDPSLSQTNSGLSNLALPSRGEKISITTLLAVYMLLDRILHLIVSLWEDLSNFNMVMYIAGSLLCEGRTHHDACLSCNSLILVSMQKGS